MMVCFNGMGEEVKCPERDSWRAGVHFSYWLIEARLHRFLVEQNSQHLVQLIFMPVKVLQKMTSYHHNDAVLLF